jgi:succinate dehydrogenase cytochrome b556 subunit
LAHRISGVAVVYFLSLHIFETLQLGLGPGAYDEATAVYKQHWFRPFEFLLVMAVVFHSLNGLRILLFDFFPRTTRYHRQIFWIGLVVFVVLTPIIGYFMLRQMFGLSLQEIFADLRSAPYAALIVGPVAIPTLFLAWRGAAMGGKQVQLSPSNSSPRPMTSQFERWAWIFMRVSGLVMIVLVFLHLYIMHIERDIVEVTGEFVAARFQSNPIWIGVDLLMLFLAWLHGLNGVRIVLTDYFRRSQMRSVVFIAGSLFGLVWLIAGALVLFYIPTLAAGA